MSSTFSSGLQKVADMTGAQTNAKLTDLAKDTYHYSEDKNARITTDFGTKISNTDDWLTASNDDHVGPSLLEDFHGREKVSTPVSSPLWWRSYLLTSSISFRSTASTMNESRNVSSMLAVLALLATSNCTRAHTMCLVLVC